jgi:hypothetical protein
VDNDVMLANQTAWIVRFDPGPPDIETHRKANSLDFMRQTAINLPPAAGFAS